MVVMYRLMFSCLQLNIVTVVHENVAAYLQQCCCKNSESQSCNCKYQRQKSSTSTWNKLSCTTPKPAIAKARYPIAKARKFKLVLVQ